MGPSASAALCFMMVELLLVNVALDGVILRILTDDGGCLCYATLRRQYALPAAHTHTSQLIFTLQMEMKVRMLEGTTSKDNA